jgi:hypothetical protein
MCHVLGNGVASDKMRVTMAIVMEGTEKTYKKPKISAQECGVNAFVIDFKLPVPKNNVLITTKDKQVKALLHGNSAFSADGQRCTMGFTLLGCNAIPRAQKE